jgi:glutathione synthase/RimK-type ligase-like ATP-grasp enzyme
MKIAIHHSPESYSTHWIEYCKQKGIDYKIVNAYDSNIVEQVSDCDAFMWHHHHEDPRDVLFAKQLLYSLEESGKRVFPNWDTGWHFDDKVGQKYLLEAIGAPLVPSYVFYTEKEALDWIKSATFPKVFKLRGGAGAANVKLARTAKEARTFVRKAFGKGFPQFNRARYLKERYRKWRLGKDSFVGVLKGLGRLFIRTDFAKMHPREKGYAYFQEFIPNNSFDTRVVVIGGQKAMVERRYVREGDFRASGSGKFEYVEADPAILRIAFDVAKRLKLQTVAFDFIYDKEMPFIVEMSYGFGTHGIRNCGGYYTSDLQWHEESKLDFYGWMIEELLH